MWKILHSVPRGVRNSIACSARQNGCLDDGNDSAAADEPNTVTTPTIQTNRQWQNRHDFRFRINDDCWSYMRQKPGHTLLEALGWGTAITAGIFATRHPNLHLLNEPIRNENEERRSLLLEYAAAMPVVSSATTKSVSVSNTSESQISTPAHQPNETKVSQSDSGFHESNEGKAVESSTAIAPTPAVRRLWNSVSSTSSQYESEIESEDESNQSKIPTSSIKNGRLLVGALKRDYDVNKKSEVPETTAAAKSKKSEPSTFAQACEQFEDLCRHAFGRHCNYNAIRALKKDDDFKAVHYWSKSSSMGYDKGHYNLARCYEEGIGTYRDLNKAKYYYGLAAAQGHQAAIQRLQRLQRLHTTQHATKIFQEWSSAEKSVQCHQEALLPET